MKQARMMHAVRRFGALIGVLVAVIVLVSPGEDARATTVLTTAIDISGTVNGQPVEASGTSITDVATGASQTTIVFTSLPDDLPPIMYGKSWKTKHHPMMASQILTAQNLGTVSPDGYDFATTMSYENGDTIVSAGQVRSTGANSHTYSLTVEGVYTGPTNGTDILPAAAVLTSTAPGTIRMEDHETIALSDGLTLELDEVGTFTLLNPDGELPSDELLRVVVNRVDFDPDTLTLWLDTTATIQPAGGGGIAEPVVLGADAAAETSAPGSSRDYTVPIAAAAGAAGLLAVAAGGWYVRRRWLR